MAMIRCGQQAASRIDPRFPMPIVLLYGDSNTYGMPPMKGPGMWDRLAPAERWPGVAAAELGSGWTLIEEGLPGRTTVRDDPIEGTHKNGRTTLPAILESHHPLDAVTIMLGTNDLKARFGAPPEDVAAGVEILLQDTVRVLGRFGPAPRLLVIAPPPILLAGFLGTMFAGGLEKSKAFGTLFRAVAERNGAGFLDAGQVIRSSEEDGIHFGAGEHRKLGEAAAKALRDLFG
jgi:lysophospholipase L1-like esterase